MAYAFSVIGTIATVAAIAAFILAGLLALIVIFGFWHERRAPETQTLEVHHAAPAELVTI